MKPKQAPTIETGSIWREDDKRFTRYVKVVGLVDADGRPHRVEAFADITLVLGGKIAIVRCDENGRTSGRVTYAASGRFGRSGGYWPLHSAVN